MSDFDISKIQDLDQVEITDLDLQAGGFSDSVTMLLLRFTRTLPFINNPRGKCTLLVYLMCAVMLLFMIQPGLPAIQSKLQELHHMKSNIHLPFIPLLLSIPPQHIL